MRKAALLAILLLLSFAIAFSVNGYAYPETNNFFTYNNIHFTYSTSTSMQTGVSSRFLCGFVPYTNGTTPISLNSLNITFSQILSGTSASQAANFYNVSLVAGYSNRFFVTSTNAGAGGADIGINMTLPNGSSYQIVYVSTVGIITTYTEEVRINVTTFNSTDYLLNVTRRHRTSAGLDTTEVAHTLPFGAYVSFDIFGVNAGGAGTTRNFIIEYPHFICAYEIPQNIGNASTAISQASLGFYYSTYRETAASPAYYLRSNFTTNRITNQIAAPFSLYYRAYLLFNTQTLNPKITFFPGINAFSAFVNNTEGVSFQINNSASYVFDATTNAWYFCPPFQTVSNASIYTLSCLFQPQTYPFQISENDFIWNDVRFALTPYTYFFISNATPLVINFSINSTTSNLEYWGMQITNFTNGSSVLIYSFNSTNPAGGSANFTTNKTGVYRVDAYFKAHNFSSYFLLTRTYVISSSTGFAKARETWELDPAFSGWAYYFIAVVVAMVAGGFAARYTIDGAGLVAIVVLWIFTIFNPNAVITHIAGLNSDITSTHATVLSTLAVLATLYMMRSYG